jgi:hypothetical protein
MPLRSKTRQNLNTEISNASALKTKRYTLELQTTPAALTLNYKVFQKKQIAEVTLPDVAQTRPNCHTHRSRPGRRDSHRKSTKLHSGTSEGRVNFKQPRLMEPMSARKACMYTNHHVAFWNDIPTRHSTENITTRLKVGKPIFDTRGRHSTSSAHTHAYRATLRHKITISKLRIITRSA